MRADVRSGAVLTGLTLALATGSLRCTLDFDRYNPASGGADAQQDQSTVTPGPDAAEAGGGADGGTDAADTDADLDAGPMEAQGPCPTPPACLTQATSCAMTCSTAYQHCINGCKAGNMGCMMGCKSTEGTCGGKCTTTCFGCAADASCASATAQSDCLTAGAPP